MESFPLVYQILVTGPQPRLILLEYPHYTIMIKSIIYLLDTLPLESAYLRTHLKSNVNKMGGKNNNNNRTTTVNDIGTMLNYNKIKKNND